MYLTQWRVKRTLVTVTSTMICWVAKVSYSLLRVCLKLLLQGRHVWKVVSLMSASLCEHSNGSNSWNSLSISAVFNRHKKSFAVIYICTRLTRESQIPFVFLGRLYHFKLLFELSTPSKRLGVKSKLDKDSLWWNCLLLWEKAKDLCWRNAVCKHRATPLLQQQHISHLKGKCSMKQCSCDRLKHFSENKYTSISFKLEICK